MDFSGSLEKEIPGLKEPMKALYRYEYFNGNAAYRFVEDKGQGQFKSFAYSDIYKSLDNNTVYLVLIKDKRIVCRDALACMEWDIKSAEEREIAGFNCKKANSNGLIVWYSEAIPVPDGPGEKMCGLPGMILAVQQGIITIEAIRVEISDTARPIEMPQAEKYLTPEEYRPLIRRF